jgi:hypothetical protein
LTPTPNITATIDAATAVALAKTATSVQQTVDAFFLTQRAQTTPTPNYTATARLCVQSYDLISPEKPNPKDPKDPIPANQRFTRDIVLRNTGDCDWLPGMFLKYSDGELLGAPRRIDMEGTVPVKPGQEAHFVFKGQAPARGGVYTGQWEVRSSGNVLVKPVLEISFFFYQ